MKLLLISVAAVAAIGTAACGSGSGENAAATSTTASSTTAHGSGGHGSGETEAESLFAFGEPADVSAATRTVKVMITDAAMAFDPDTVDAKVGDTIAFEVSNKSSIQHDFTLGDEATQLDHAEQMASMAQHGGMADEANAFVVDPGQTKTLAWKFTEPGTVIYGCHIPGHYASGMKGTVEVRA